MIDKTTKEPYINIIFGNFYCPAYDNKAFIDETMKMIRALGYNSVMFDTKAWEDFRERYAGEEPSQYVGMQEYMGKVALAQGLTYNFLLLYLNGDNLYPHIRFSPPIFGEEVVTATQMPGRWYKYWSAAAKESMQAHVERIMAMYRAGSTCCLVKRQAVCSQGRVDDTKQSTNYPSDEHSVCFPDMPDAPKQSTDYLVAGQTVCLRDGFDGTKQSVDYPSDEHSVCFPDMPDASKQSTDCLRDKREVLPVCSMWDPVVAPSFDREGIRRYTDFLRLSYGNDITAFNRCYRLTKTDFDELQPEEYWYRLKYGEERFFTEGDVRESSPEFIMWRDNAAWRKKELVLYFQDMQYRLKEKNPDLFLCPDLSQWGYFLNIYGRIQVDHDNDYSDLWDTSLRGIDMYAIAPYVDSCHFITVPVTPDGYPDADVVSCQHSMMRVMNAGREFIGGIYWGRFIYQDIYAFLTPAEIIGTMVAAGIDGYTSYGINGLDDGGVLNRMEDSFLTSLTIGNEWCARVIPQINGPRKKEGAILFPAEMSAYEPFEVGNNKIRRLDLLGWYKICGDLGYQTDVVSFHEIEAGRLADYRFLVLPANDCYEAERHEGMEAAIRAWVAQGGVLLHGPEDALVERCFGITGRDCPKTPFRYGSVIIPQGVAFQTYDTGESIADYLDGVGACVAKHEWEKGTVYSFGVQMGAAYAAKNIPHVPYEQSNQEMYPLQLSQSPLLKDIFGGIMVPVSGIAERGIETGVFESGMVVVNHRSVPYHLTLTYAKADFQYALPDKMLMPHSAVWIPKVSC